MRPPRPAQRVLCLITTHDSADRISGQFLFYHDHNFTKSKGNLRFQRHVPLFVPIGVCVTTHDDGTASDVTIDEYWGITGLSFISSKAKETHRSWLAGRGWQVVVAELIPVTWHKASHLIGSNQIFNHDHDRMVFIRQPRGYLYVKAHLSTRSKSFNTLRPRQDGCHFPDDIFKCIFLNENV